MFIKNINFEMNLTKYILLVILKQMIKNFNCIIICNNNGVTQRFFNTDYLFDIRSILAFLKS